MDELDANLLLCKACGRDFAHLNAYSSHFGSCRKGKRKIASALELAKENYRIKRHRLQTASSSGPYSDEIPEGGGQAPTPTVSSATTADLAGTPVRYALLLLHIFLLVKFSPQCVDRASSNP